MILDGSEESCDGPFALFGEREREKKMKGKVCFYYVVRENFLSHLWNLALSTYEDTHAQ